MGQLLEYKGYHAKIEFSAEDETFVGVIVGIQDSVVFDGDTVEEIKTAFHESVDDYLNLCRELGKDPDKEYKGTFNIRIPSELHKRATIEAERRGISLNQFIQRSIECELSGLHQKESVILMMVSKDFQKYKTSNMENMFDPFKSSHKEDLKKCQKNFRLPAFAS